MLTTPRLIPTSAKKSEEAIHRASRPRHNRKWELQKTDSDSKKAQANALPAHKRLRVGERAAGPNLTKEVIDHEAPQRCT
jgi:hypothetical protein